MEEIKNTPVQNKKEEVVKKDPLPKAKEEKEVEEKEICEKEDRSALMVEKEKVLLAIKEQKDKYSGKVVLAMSEVLDILKAIETDINK